MWPFLFISNHLQASGWELARPSENLRRQIDEVVGYKLKVLLDAENTDLGEV